MKSKTLKILSLLLCIFLLPGCSLLSNNPKEKSNKTPTSKTAEEMIADSTLQYPATNSMFRYNVYTEYVTISECLSESESIVIPNTIEELPVLGIEEGAFEDNLTIKSITMCNNITFVNEKAFAGCLNLELAAISPAVTTIGEDAFYECQNLQSVVIPSGVEIVRDGTFSDCTTLTNVTIEEAIVKSAEEEKGEKKKKKKDSGGTLFGGNSKSEEGRTIEGSAFTDCPNLTNVWIPADIITIEDKAFKNSTDNLIIYGYAASAAAVFGAENKIDFVVLDKEQFNNIASSNDLIIPNYPTTGGSITGDNWSIKLTSADIAQSIGGVTAKDGNTMVVLHFEVLNTDRQNAYFNGLNAKAIASGYSKNMTYLNKNPGTATFLAGEVAPGESISGYLAYEVNAQYKYIAVDFSNIEGFKSVGSSLAIYAEKAK